MANPLQAFGIAASMRKVKHGIAIMVLVGCCIFIYAHKFPEVQAVCHDADGGGHKLVPSCHNDHAVLAPVSEKHSTLSINNTILKIQW